MVFLLVSCLTRVGAGNESETPFQIPPSGKPEQLVGQTDVPPPTAMAFDSRNRPYLINNRNPEAFGRLWTLRDGQWQARSFLDVVDPDKQPKARQMHANGELVIDDQDHLYATVNGQLIYSRDFGRTFTAYPCRGSLELRTGFGDLTRPPAISQITQSSYVDRDKAKWARRGTLSVLLPRKTAGGLVNWASRSRSPTTAWLRAAVGTPAAVRLR